LFTSDFVLIVTHPQVHEASKLPKTICLDCLTKLNQFNEFFTTTNENQVILEIVFGEKSEVAPATEEVIEEFYVKEVKEVEEIIVQEIGMEHDDALDEENEVIFEITQPEETTTKKRKFDRFDCYICNQKLTSNFAFIQHMNKQHAGKEIRYSCFYCPNYVKKYRSFTRHLESHQAKRFTCDICQRSFSQKITLVQHINSHSSAKLYECTDCNIKFKQCSSLFKHRKQKHSDYSPTCSLCNKSFVNNETLQQHLKSKHTESHQKDVKCDECTKLFASKSALVYHRMAEHQKGNNDNFCKPCNKRFKTSIVFTRHKKMFH